LWGTGNNGKSTLMEMLKDILGEYYSPISKDLLLKQKFSQGRDAATPSLMQLRGRRLCSTAETSADQPLDEPMIKMLTGGDTFVARALRENPVNVRCMAKLMMLTNEPPSYNTYEEAIALRIKMLPFLAKFSRTLPDRDRRKNNAAPAEDLEASEERKCCFLIDQEFVSRLRTTHLSEVFTLLVRGAFRWYQEKTLTYPSICGEALDRHNKEHDALEVFIAECCSVGGEQRVNVGVCHRAFNRWFTATGQTGIPPPVRQIEASMKAKNFGVKFSDGKKYIGLAVTSAEYVK
jgi:putative DNA primase/helicase